MAEASNFDKNWETKYVRRRVPISCKASTRITALVELQIEMVDAGKIPFFCASGSDCFEISSYRALESQLVGRTIDVDCRPVPISGRYGWQWLVVEVVAVRTGHDLDVSDCVVVEQRAVHVSVMLRIASKKLAQNGYMHWLRWQ